MGAPQELREQLEGAEAAAAAWEAREAMADARAAALADTVQVAQLTHLQPLISHLNSPASPHRQAIFLREARQSKGHFHLPVKCAMRRSDAGA